MNLVHEVNNLPETVPTNTLAPYFDKVMNEMRPSNGNDKQSAFDVLYELSLKQWHNYELLPSDIRDRVDKYVATTVQGDLTKKLVETAIPIIGCLGLNQSYGILRNRRNDFPGEIGQEIDNAIIEFGESVDDPYSR